MIYLLIFLLVCAAIIWLQIYLSRRPQWVPGIVLPVVFFGVALIRAFGVYCIRLEFLSPREGLMIAGQAPTWGKILLVFAQYNIPTVATLFIHAICRWRRNSLRSQMDKMRIDDLE